MNTRPATASPRARGFTILELMTAVAVLGVLLAVGVPSFTEMTRNNRTAAQANNLVTALQIGRNEASKRGLPVVVCAANAARSACAGATTNWENGWLIFLDEGGAAGVIDGPDTILQSSDDVPATLTLTTDVNDGFVRYGRNGAILNAAPVTFGLQHNGCTGTNRRSITVARTGRVGLTKVACT